MFSSLLRLFENTIRICLTVSVSIMLLVIFIDILMREIFNQPLTWHLEISQLCLIITTYLGAALALKKKQHISINMFTAMLGKKRERYFSIFTQILTLPFLCILAFASVNIIKHAKGVTPSLQLPIWLYYSPILVGAICLVIFAVLSLVDTIKEKPSDEDLSRKVNTDSCSNTGAN